MINRNELIFEVTELQDEMSRVMMDYRIEHWMALDLSIAQLKSIVYIHSKGKSNFRELAKALDVTPPVVTGIVDRLVSQVMIRRVIDKKDRRVKWLAISTKGRVLLEDIAKKFTTEVYGILRILSDEELSVVVRGFSALVKASKTYLESKYRETEGIQPGS